MIVLNLWERSSCQINRDCKPQEESPESGYRMFCQDYEYIYLASLVSVAFRMQSRHDPAGKLGPSFESIINEKWHNKTRLLNWAGDAALSLRCGYSRFVLFAILVDHLYLSH